MNRHGAGGGLEALYRREHAAVAAWHFCERCSGWPRGNYQTSAMPPRNGSFCRQCVARRLAGSCPEHCVKRSHCAGIGRHT